MHGRIFLLGIALLAFLSGCSEYSAPQPRDEPEAALAQTFDPAATGSISGRIVWDGETPKSHEMLVRASPFNPFLHKNPARFVLPHVPQVNPKNRGVANAVVYLRGIDPQRSRPWDHPKVRVEFRDRNLLVEQGGQRTDVGFVRRGSVIEIVNRDTEYHNVRARGATFFGMPLVEANQLHERKLTQAGLVDLTCAAGYYWLHAHLFVAEHPYYARSDAHGKYVFEQVPAGQYEIVCWLPNWHIVRKEVDPETGITARLAWTEPKEQTQKVCVQAGQQSEISFQWSQATFDP